jgi:hypothetical protein
MKKKQSLLSIIKGNNDLCKLGEKIVIQVGIFILSVVLVIVQDEPSYYALLPIFNIALNYLKHL